MNGIVKEAHRLLKPDGKLIALEWDMQNRTGRKIKFAPLYVMEVLVNSKYFREFYHSNKTSFFRRYGFEMFEKRECSYTSVMSIGPILD